MKPSTEIDPATGRDLVLGYLNAQPITTVPPSNSEVDGAQPITLAEVMDTINQLSSIVCSQISQTNTS